MRITFNTRPYLRGALEVERKVSSHSTSGIGVGELVWIDEADEYTPPLAWTDNLAMTQRDHYTIYTKTPEPRRDMDGNIIPPRTKPRWTLLGNLIKAANQLDAENLGKKKTSIAEDWQNYGR